MRFTGRDRDLALLRAQLDGITSGLGATRGRAVLVTGRRRVGKSRVVQEFVARSGVPSIVFQATWGRLAAAERADFVTTVATSGLPEADLIAGTRPDDWSQALRALAAVLPADRPVIVVIDEVPWLTQGDPEFEGALQTVWDRHLSDRPVLLLLIGSNQSVMARLTDHDRPFLGRASVMRVQPLNPADVADATGLEPADALDAWLVTGGFPQIVASWQAGESRAHFLTRSLAEPLSPLLVSGELTLLGEDAPAATSRAVLEAVGVGERTFTAIARAAGGGVTRLASGALTPLLRSLTDAGALASDLPLSTAPDTKNRRYRIADPYLRFWLAFGPMAVPLADRGLGHLAYQRVEASWSSWRGRAVEPLVRESLQRLLMAQRGEAVAIGGWWNRQNNPEIDLVVADKAPVARRVHWLGSVKWHDSAPFDRHDFDALVRGAPVVPGATGAGLVAVSRTGVVPGLPLHRVWGPDDLVATWR